MLFNCELLLEGHLIAPFIKYLENNGYEVTRSKSDFQPFVISSDTYNHFLPVDKHGNFQITGLLTSVVIDFYKQYER